MDDPEWADRFVHDVDTFVKEAARVESAPAPAHYRQAVDLARVLATTDFSVESRTRQSLRRRLLNQLDGHREWERRSIPPSHRLLPQRHPALGAATVVLASLLLLTLMWPRPFTVMIGGVEASMQHWLLGQRSAVTQVASSERAAALLVAPAVGVVAQSGSFVGTAPPAPRPPSATPVAGEREATELSSPESEPSRGTYHGTSVPLGTVSAP